ncbi:hypothetical protein, partial [Tychonema sp. LEGE 07203]|uniref:hypothetical protein n=1 Tax=Tychonema sp. LEGE 07203 TaxID=1828671 RepID=UPI001D13F5D2
TFCRNAIKVSIYICYESGRSRFYHPGDRFYFVRSHPRMKPPWERGGENLTIFDCHQNLQFKCTTAYKI